MGRVDVEGCCWWGRGVLRDVTRGRCFFGQLNYHIGKRAAMECRPSMYPEIDFCNFPGKVTFQYVYFLSSQFDRITSSSIFITRLPFFNLQRPSVHVAATCAGSLVCFTGSSTSSHTSEMHGTTWTKSRNYLRKYQQPNELTIRRRSSPLTAS